MKPYAFKDTCNRIHCGIIYADCIKDAARLICFAYGFSSTVEILDLETDNVRRLGDF